MKLKRTLYELLDSNERYDNAELGDNIEKIADEFAIGFAYWCEWRNDRAFKTYEELLEIYKKEKGL